MEESLQMSSLVFIYSGFKRRVVSEASCSLIGLPRERGSNQAFNITCCMRICI